MLRTAKGFWYGVGRLQCAQWNMAVATQSVAHPCGSAAQRRVCLYAHALSRFVGQCGSTRAAKPARPGGHDSSQTNTPAAQRAAPCPQDGGGCAGGPVRARAAQPARAGGRAARAAPGGAAAAVLALAGLWREPGRPPAAVRRQPRGLFELRPGRRARRRAAGSSARCLLAAVDASGDYVRLPSKRVCAWLQSALLLCAQQGQVGLLDRGLESGHASGQIHKRGR